MFLNTVTLFNYGEQEDIYYPTLLENVEFQPNYKTKFNRDGTEDLDLALLIVKYFYVNYERHIYGTDKIFRMPKIWKKIPAEEKHMYFTIKPGEYDFFIKGDYTSEIDVKYENFKNLHDEIFFIHSVKDFEDDLKHWEIEGY